jgi:hypothetical protein
MVVYGVGLLLALVGWSWLRSQRHPWVRRHRGTLGWILSAMVFAFLFTLMRLLMPKI